jgi:hypothetical protein
MILGLRVAVAILVLLAFFPEPAQPSDPEWVNIQLNLDRTTQLQNEEQIAINPTSPLNMVAVWRDFRLGYRKVGWSYTFDGGETWTEGGLLPEPTYTQQSDPGITADNGGNFYAIVLSYNGNINQPNGLIIVKSSDGGVTWGPPMAAISGVQGAFEDKEFIACDRTFGRHDGNLYVTWTRFASSVDILARRSTDSGLSWSNTIAVSDESSVQFPIPVVGKGGEVYIAWCSFTHSAIMLDVSMDGGASFGADRQVVPVYSVATVINGGVDAYSSPHMDADISNGAYSGRLYIAFMDRRGGNRDYDIWVISSDDRGLTWSSPVRVNDDTPGNNRDQFHPWLAVDNTGVVTVVWLDRRHDEENLTYHCYISQSTDGGASWSPNVQVSTEPSDPINAWPSNLAYESRPPGGGEAHTTSIPEVSVSMAGLLGEYIGVVAHDGIPTPIWTDIRNGHQDVFAGHLEGLGGVDWPTPEDYAKNLVIVPNPAGPHEGVTVWTGAEGPGVLTIHDAMGRTIRTLNDVLAEDGRLTFRSEEVANATGGVYFLRLKTSTGTSYGKLMLVE